MADQTGTEPWPAACAGPGDVCRFRPGASGPGPCSTERRREAHRHPRRRLGREAGGPRRLVAACRRRATPSRPPARRGRAGQRTSSARCPHRTRWGSVKRGRAGEDSRRQRPRHQRLGVLRFGPVDRPGQVAERRPLDPAPHHRGWVHAVQEDMARAPGQSGQPWVQTRLRTGPRTADEGGQHLAPSMTVAMPSASGGHAGDEVHERGANVEAGGWAGRPGRRPRGERSEPRLVEHEGRSSRPGLDSPGETARALRLAVSRPAG